MHGKKLLGWIAFNAAASSCLLLANGVFAQTEGLTRTVTTTATAQAGDRVETNPAHAEVTTSAPSATQALGAESVLSNASADVSSSTTDHEVTIRLMTSTRSGRLAVLGAAAERAIATADTVFTFAPTARSVPYTLAIATTRGGAKAHLRIALTVDGKTRFLGGNDTVLVQTGANKQYRLAATFSALTRCANCTHQATAVLRASFRRASLGVRLIGGIETAVNELDSVGALLNNGTLHCTGTLIGKHTVLTAAHCLYTYTAAAMTFVVGKHSGSPITSSGVVGYDFPKANPNDSFAYDDQNLIDDIGVVYLKDDLGYPTYSLHANDPNLLDVATNGTTLLFVGYGYTRLLGRLTGQGIKRKVPMSIAIPAGQPRKFTYGGATTNTCFYDSGGPAFAQTSSGQLVVAGITSGGDVACSQNGVDTRVQLYTQWVTPRIK
jgi:hypothetical protein